jgi:hypothetical protein
LFLNQFVLNLIVFVVMGSPGFAMMWGGTKLGYKPKDWPTDL